MWLSTYVGIANELNQKIDLDVWKIKKYQSTRYYLWVFMSLKGEIKEGVGNGHETTSKC